MQEDGERTALDCRRAVSLVSPGKRLLLPLGINTDDDLFERPDCGIPRAEYKRKKEIMNYLELAAGSTLTLPFPSLFRQAASLRPLCVFYGLLKCFEIIAMRLHKKMADKIAKASNQQPLQAVYLGLRGIAKLPKLHLQLLPHNATFHLRANVSTLTHAKCRLRCRWCRWGEPARAVKLFVNMS